MAAIIFFLLILSLLVFVHEIGHFFIAKKLKMRIEEFGFGFPPRMFGLIKKEGWRLVRGSGTKILQPGETIYSVNWIPLGGFVKIHGESGGHKDDPGSFSGRPPWQRFAVLIAGVAMNFALAAVLLSVGLAVGLPSVVDDTISSSARLSDEKVQIMTVVAESPAARAGLMAGDEVLSIDDTIFSSVDGARDYIKSREGQPVNLLIQRGQDALVFSLLAEELPNYEGGKGVGIGLVKTALVSYPWYLAALKGVGVTCLFTWEVLKAFGNLLWNLITHQGVSADLSGPVGIAVMTGEAAALGLVYLLQFAAILSINLSVVNILPFPALDGGRILFLFFEKLRGRAVGERVEGLVHNLGFAALIALIIFVTFHDMAKFGGQIMGAVRNLIGV